MKVTITRKVLHELIEKLAPCIEKVGSNEMRSYKGLLKIEAFDNKIFLSMFGSDIRGVLTCIKDTASYKIAQDGFVGIDAKVFINMIKVTPDGSNINLERKENQLVITINRKKAIFPCVSEDIFPPVFENSGKLKFSLKKNVLDGISRVYRFCDKTEDLRNPALKGVCLKEGIICGTNSKELVLYRDQEISDMPEVVIPGVAAGVISKIMEGECEISVNDGIFYIKSGGILCAIPMLTHEYPKIVQLVNGVKADKRFVVNKVKFKEVIRCASVFIEEKGKPIRITIDGDKLKIEGYSKSNSSTFEDTIDLDCPCTDIAAPITFGFNWQYLLDIMEAIEGDSVTIYFDRHTTPVITKNERMLAMAMPLAIGG